MSSEPTAKTVTTGALRRPSVAGIVIAFAFAFLNLVVFPASVILERDLQVNGVAATGEVRGHKATFTKRGRPILHAKARYRAGCGEYTSWVREPPQGANTGTEIRIRYAPLFPRLAMRDGGTRDPWNESLAARSILFVGAGLAALVFAVRGLRRRFALRGIPAAQKEQRPGNRLAAAVIAGGCLVLLALAAHQTLTARRFNRDDLDAYRRASGDAYRIAKAARDYIDATGDLPGALGRLSPDYIENLPRDPWGNRFELVADDGGARAVCYGKDGRPGGRYADFDLEWPVGGWPQVKLNALEKSN